MFLRSNGGVIYDHVLRRNKLKKIKILNDAKRNIQYMLSFKYALQILDFIKRFVK